MVRPAVREDCGRIARFGLRNADLIEIGAARGTFKPQAILEECFDASVPHCFTLIVDGEPAAIFGVAPVDAEWGTPWFLATPLVYKAAGTLARYTRAWVDWMQTVRPKLHNLALNNVASGNLRWLEHAGFTLHPPVVAGPADAEFIPFTRT